jgi:hypothetical protein
VLAAVFLLLNVVGNFVFVRPDLGDTVQDTSAAPDEAVPDGTLAPTAADVPGDATEAASPSPTVPPPTGGAEPVGGGGTAPETPPDGGGT